MNNSQISAIIANYNIRRCVITFDSFRQITEINGGLQIKNTNLLIRQIVKILKALVGITDDSVIPAYLPE